MSNFKKIFAAALLSLALASGASALSLQDIMDRLSFDLTYGAYEGTYTNYSTAGASSGKFYAPSGNFGIGINFELPVPDTMKYFSEDSSFRLGYQSNAVSDGLLVSYIHLDYLTSGDSFFGSFGLNTSLWNRDIAGAGGFNIGIGKIISERISAGLRYAYLKGYRNVSGLDNIFEISYTVFTLTFSL